MSSHALRAVGREADARARLAAQHEAAGDVARAAAVYQELIGKLEAWKVRPADDLRDAAVMSDVWATRAPLLRLRGQGSDADALDRRSNRDVVRVEPQAAEQRVCETADAIGPWYLVLSSWSVPGPLSVVLPDVTASLNTRA
jgi:hypothetical protein